jgi:alkanesulfonate monooxygenase SsuD/methylene tetrahydromethanopterin reductase-like flavin-dependent oxidoreductase (luciferase family)
MDFGIILGDQPVTVDAREHLDLVLRQVEAAQRSGFTYICIGQHFLYEGFRWLQPIPLLARLAAETGPEVKLAPTVIVAPFYHPVVLAEELATLDVISGGRLIVGLGSGYNPTEFDQFEVPYEQRFRRLAEAIELMRLAWAPERFDFHGEFWTLRNASPHVLPLQRPHPPLWMGAMRPVGIRRAARLGDAWMVTPEMPFWEAEQGYEIFNGERRARGLEPVRLPIRREIVIGRDRADALSVYASRARERYIAYTERGNQELQRHGNTLADFEQWAAERAIFGTADECTVALAQLDPAKFGPVIVRPAWPGLSPEEVTDYIADVGRQVVAAVA